MPRIQRVGDVNTGGGRILKGDSTVRVNGQPIAVENMPVSSHTPNQAPHVCAQTRSKIVKNVRVNGLLIIVEGDVDTCGHVRASGSPDTKS